MHKKDDYRTTEQKIYDFVVKFKKIILIISFLVSLVIFIVSFLCSNEGGRCVIVAYPLFLLSFLIDWKFPNYPKAFPFSASLMFILIELIGFIIGFFL